MASACTEKKSRLEVISEQSEAENTKVLEAAQVSLPSLPATSGAPPTVPSQIWMDLHWLPEDVVGINGTAPGQPPFLADWVFSQPFAENDACRALERSLARGYGIEWDQPPQSFVFFGAADFEQVEQCAQQFMAGMGGSARFEDGTLRLTMDGVDSRVHFARRGEELVAIVDDGRMGTVAEARQDRLKGNEQLVSLLADVSVSGMAWSAAARDMTQVPLGVPSSGYTMHIGEPGQLWTFRFAFASEPDAKRALEAAGPFMKEAEAFLGVSLHADLQLDGDVLAVAFNLTDFFMLDPAKMQAVQKKLEDFAAGRPQPAQ